jgi:hypothetical protein
MLQADKTFQSEFLDAPLIANRTGQRVCDWNNIRKGSTWALLFIDNIRLRD